MQVNQQNIDGLCGYLTQTLSPDPGQRGAAENFLKQTEIQPGFSLLLLHVITLDAAPPQARQAGAIYFKNFIMKYWVSDEADGKDIIGADRDTLKQHIVGVLIRLPKQLQGQLHHAMALISAEDFPAKWPNLLPELIRAIDTPDFTQIATVLEMLNHMFFRYRSTFKSSELWEEIKYVCDNFMGPFLAVFQRSVAQVGQLQDKVGAKSLFSAFLLVCEVWYSLNTHELGAEYFEDNLQEYMTAFLNFLSYSNPLLDPDDTDEPGLLDQTKACICLCTNLWAKSYEEKFQPFVESFVQCIWNLVVSIGDAPRFDSTVNNAIKFLTSVVKKPVNRSLFEREGALGQLCQKVVIPQIKLRPADLELFEMEGLEYVRRDMEGSDVDTRRRTTIDLVRGLCVLFNDQVSGILKQHVNVLLQEYSSDPGQKWVSKDAAMYIIYALSAQGSTTAKGITQVNQTVNILDFFSSQVLPELNDSKIDSLPILKADCLKFLAAFRSQLPPDASAMLIQTMIRFLASNQYVIHTYAAAAIERLMSVKENGVARVNSATITPMVESLLVALFKTLDHDESKENEYVIKAIMRTCAVAQAAMLPYVSVLIDKVTSILAFVSENPRNPRFNHYLFETLACLIHFITPSNPQAVDSFEAKLFPPFQQMLGKDTCEEFGPYVFLILAKLLGARSDVSGPYQQIFLPLLSPALWANSGNIPSLSNLLCIYLEKGYQVPPENLTGLLGIFQKLNNNTKHDKYGLDILAAVTQFLPVNSWQQFLPQIFNFQFKRLHDKKTPGYVRGLLLFWSRFIIKHGVTTMLTAMDSVQPGIFHMVMDKLWLPSVRSIGQALPRKICGMGMVNILCTASPFLEAPYLALWPNTLRMLVELLALPPIADAAEKDLMDVADKGFSAAKLAFAKPALYDPCPEQKNVAEFLATSLGQLSAAKPGQFGPAIESLPEDHKGQIRQYLSAARVTLS
jgi:exportin-2 (importin alpha re-exporter)